MENQFLDDFMDKFKYEGLTYDDISLITQYADFMPEETDVSSDFSRNIKLHIPFVSAAMDTVTESDMAISMARLGGIGVIHKNLSITHQAGEVRKVKHYLNGFIKDPVVFHPDQTIADMLDEKARRKYSFSGFPIVDDEGKLVGIITAKDMKFQTDYTLRLRDVMTKDLITAPHGTQLQEAFDIMVKNKIGKLPTVNESGLFSGLYSFQDVRMLIENVEPNYNRDEFHRLRVAAAVGPYDEERAAALVDADVDALVIDTAHGHTKGVIETIKNMKKEYSDRVDIVAGNIATSEAAKSLADAGADAVKVGIGPGSICTTRVVAGVGIPQISAIYNARKTLGNEIPIIADGGIKQSGDIAKSIAVGASSVMMGSTLAGTEESPGEKILYHGRKYVVYRGMGSLEAMKQSKGSRERYGQSDVDDEKRLVPQGVEGLILYRGSVSEVVHLFEGGLRYSLGYCGTKNIEALQNNAKFCKITNAGLKEAHPHDIKLTKDAPNYITE